MIVARSRSLVGVMVVGALALTPGCESCKKKATTKSEEAKKDPTRGKRALENVPAPEDEIVEVTIRDPESFAKRVVDGAGFSAEVGPSPYDKVIDSIHDENVQKALKAIDPHGAMALVALWKIDPDAKEKPHFAAAARLKDPDVAATALAAADKGGDMKTWSSKVLDTTVYEPGKEGEIAVYGDQVVFADTRDALEAAAKYASSRSARGAKLDHDVVVRVPLDKVGPNLEKLGKTAYAKLSPGDIPPRVRAALDPLVGPILAAIGDMGESLISFDADSGYLKQDGRLAAKDTFAAWLASVPTGDASALLTAPKGEGAGVQRIPDGLGPLVYALIGEALAGATSLTAAEKADVDKHVRAVGKSLGHELVYVHKSHPATAGKGFDSEFMVRFDLMDATAAKTAMPALRKHALKLAGGTGGAPTVKPYKKAGADGETIELAASATVFGSPPGGSAPKDHVAWAVKGSYLYLDVCIGCASTLVDAAVDPAAKDTLGDDAAAKEMIGAWPTTQIFSASYTQSWSFPSGLGWPTGGAPSGIKPGMPMWGWTRASSDSLVGKGAVPLGFVGDLARFYLAVFSRFGMGAPPPY